MSFETEQLMENLASLMDTIVRDKPAAVKGPFFKSAFITSSMGPGIPLDINSLQALKPSE